MNVWLKAGIVGAGAVLLDLSFHLFFTYPQETITYFFVKFLLAFLISRILFSKGFTILSGVVYGAVFALLFSLYYRFSEFFYSAGFGSRVPDIMLGGFTVVFSQNPLLSVSLWGLAHFLAFIIPAVMMSYVDG